MDGDRNNPPAVSTMMIALIIMFTTLRPMLIPPDVLNVSLPKTGMTQADFQVITSSKKEFLTVKQYNVCACSRGSFSTSQETCS
ncbi:unnamed protein product [Brassica oleracea var. botrytis]